MRTVWTTILALFGAAAVAGPPDWPQDYYVATAAGVIYYFSGFGNSVPFADGLASPYGLAALPDGRIYAVERISGEVTEISAGGNLSAAPAHAFGLNNPRGLIATADGRLLVTELFAGRVLDVTAGGDVSTAPIFATGLSGPRDLLETADGRILVAEEYAGEVTDITAGGDFFGAAAFASGLDTPYGIAESLDGRLYVSEIVAGRVKDITAGGNVAGAPAFASGLDSPDDIALVAPGRLIALEEFAGNIVDITLGDLGGSLVGAVAGLPQQILAAPGDTDLDAVSDNEDNCVLHHNPGQSDSGGDGFGDRCDPDYDDDCLVDFADVATLAMNFFQSDPQTDLNGDELINFADLQIMQDFVFGPPGPTALPNGCTPGVN